MTEIELVFNIGKVSKVEGDKDIPVNAKILKLELNYPTNIEDINKFYEKVPPAQILKEIHLGFFDGAETGIYNKLLDNNKKGEFFIDLS